MGECIYGGACGRYGAHLRQRYVAENDIFRVDGVWSITVLYGIRIDDISSGPGTERI
jgi:hypothetical protein